MEFHVHRNIYIYIYIYIYNDINCPEIENLCSQFLQLFRILKPYFLIKGSCIYTSFLSQNREHVPETETCVPCVPEI